MNKPKWTCVICGKKSCAPFAVSCWCLKYPVPMQPLFSPLMVVTRDEV